MECCELLEELAEYIPIHPNTRSKCDYYTDRRNIIDIYVNPLGKYLYIKFVNLVDLTEAVYGQNVRVTLEKLGRTVYRTESPCGFAVYMNDKYVVFAPKCL